MDRAGCDRRTCRVSNHLRIQAYVMRALEEYQRTFGINPLPAKTEVLP